MIFTVTTKQITPMEHAIHCHIIELARHGVVPMFTQTLHQSAECHHHQQP